MSMRLPIVLFLACGLVGCSAGETENTIAPDPTIQPPPQVLPKKTGRKPTPTPNSQSAVPIK